MKPRTGGVYVPVPAPRARHTALPGIPLAVRWWARWKATTLARVVGPNTPSGLAAWDCAECDMQNLTFASRRSWRSKRGIRDV